MKSTTSLIKTSTGWPSLRAGCIPIVVMLAASTILPAAYAVNPPPDGGYANFTTAEGKSALLGLTTGAGNTAVGSFSLESLTTGSFNTAVGAVTLLSNNGDSNTAIGTAALLANTDGDSNTAVGVDALLNNTGGDTNTAIGTEALISNIEGSFNTATGFAALSLNVNGCCDTADGTNALFLSTGGGNTAVGFFALSNITTGTFNVAVGENAGDHLTEGDSNNIDIGFGVEGVASESNTIRIGNSDIADTFIRGINGTTIASGTTVLVASNGHLGTVTSSQRFKKDVTPMDKASEALFSFKPVTFRYRKEIDPVSTLQFGLIAEDVEKINPDLVVRDEKGQVNSVRYDQVNAMLLNEFLKEHRKVRELEATLARAQNDFQSKLSEQEKQIAALASGLHKVSAELEISRPAVQVASLPAVALPECRNNP